METWKVEHCPHFHQEIAYQASPWLPLACVTFFIKVALVSPMLCPIWAMDSSVKSSSQANSSPFPNPTAVSPLFIFSPSFSGSRDALWCRWQSGARAGCHGQFKLCYRLCHCLHPSILTSTCPHQSVSLYKQNGCRAFSWWLRVFIPQKPLTHVRSRSQTLTGSLKPWGNWVTEEWETGCWLVGIWALVL